MDMWRWGITATIILVCTFWMWILIILSPMNQCGLDLLLDGHRCFSEAWPPLKPVQQANRSRPQWVWVARVWTLTHKTLQPILVLSYGNAAFECPFEVERQCIVIREKSLDMVRWCTDGLQQSDMLDTWHCSYMVQKAQYLYCICVICQYVVGIWYQSIDTNSSGSIPTGKIVIFLLKISL